MRSQWLLLAAALACSNSDITAPATPTTESASKPAALSTALPDAGNTTLTAIALCGKDYNAGVCGGAKLTQLEASPGNGQFSVIRHGGNPFNYTTVPFSTPIAGGLTQLELLPDECGPVATYCPFVEVLVQQGQVVDFGVFQLKP